MQMSSLGRVATPPRWIACAPMATHMKELTRSQTWRRRVLLLNSNITARGNYRSTPKSLDRHGDAAVTSLIPARSCRSCRPNAPFAELVRLSRTSIADEMREEHSAASVGRVTLLTRLSRLPIAGSGGPIYCAQV